LKVKYSHDPPLTPLGTAGPIKKAEKLIGHEEPFLVLNGDIFTNFNYLEMIKIHDEEKAVATIALYKVKDPSRYGVADIGPDGLIKEFVEKPTKGIATTNLINAGLYIMSPSIFQLIPIGRAVSMEREVFPKLVKEKKLYGHVIEGLWKDIGKPEEYLQTNKLILSSLRTKSGKKPSTYNEIDPIAVDKNVIIGEKSSIGPYAIIGRNVSIGKNVEIKDSIILPNTIIEDYASIRGAIVGEGAFLGKRSKVTNGCVIGDQVKLKEGVSIAEKSSICPGREITESILKATMIC
jgi:mannose-1-phosphate guanylyltransferase